MKIIKTRSFELAAITKGNPDAEKLALVLPGRLDTKDYIHMTSSVDFLAEQGFYAVSIDPPFSWDSPGDIKNYSTTNYLKAVNELITYFNKPTLLVGHSRGGAVAMLASTNNLVTSLVLAMANYMKVTPPDRDYVRGDYSVELRGAPPGLTRTKEKIEFHLPLTYFSDAVKFDQSEALRVFSGPKLLICGTQDKFIPAECVKKIYDTLHDPKIFLELNSEHDYRLHADMVQAVNQAIGKFIENYFPA